MYSRAFHTRRWSQAFLSVSGENAQEAFLYFKALVSPVKSMHGVLSGHSAALMLEKILRESAGGNSGDKSPALEYAICFICLLVEKKCFKYADALMENIEQKLDEQNGILDITLEAASPLTAELEKELTRMIKEKTNAAGIKMKTHVKPELLGGFLLRTHGFYIDASLKGQLQKMSDELTATIWTGGSNG
ncbi:MAG: ATP synthase F1 subunit delta [Treponema sp.]|jgi:ATP synthase F1 delta subunit|nr:ATP synthase F1 subunit delta [Treponema sp.]